MPVKEHFCAQCARHMRTCCQECEIYVTPGDLERIAAHTGLSGFTEFRVPADPDYLSQANDPAWAEAVLRPDGARRVLQRTPGGDCMFLSPQGCLLPMEVRPLVCRLFPYEYTERGILAEPADRCPRRLLDPGESLFHAIGMNLDEAQRWHKQIYAEIRLEKAAPCALV